MRHLLLAARRRFASRATMQFFGAVSVESLPSAVVCLIDPSPVPFVAPTPTTVAAAAPPPA
jgi:hypothetical protein